MQGIKNDYLYDTLNGCIIKVHVGESDRRYQNIIHIVKMMHKGHNQKSETIWYPQKIARKVKLYILYFTILNRRINDISNVLHNTMCTTYYKHASCAILTTSIQDDTLTHKNK